ncbi:MAG: hypothetical protein GWM92_11495 [Gemmatimonadetes bacterium]|nr:hypothetical protein [Gemmatimonadota bacterium]NIR79323.1 hypothetical protein [Gemmatimonadota bacterium]NIT87979.1 hypothetical protein [Gemmatimonadota bacterium]NIU31830.1 hypothetical protein [Gemmatimonadota bacterium]NIU36447.1 hypothetical protein [Gemmatimonadota bacterium]
MPATRARNPRTLVLLLAAITLVAAVPVPAHHHADHPDEAVHLEHDHGGHGGLLEQEEARVPAPYGPPALQTVAVEIPEGEAAFRSRPAPDDFLVPLGRPPPPDLPRAPPLHS